jgi:hypothetical protein
MRSVLSLRGAMAAVGLLMAAVALMPWLMHHVILARVESRLQGIASRGRHALSIERMEFTSLARLEITGLCLQELQAPSGEEPTLACLRLSLEFYPLGFLTGSYVRAVYVDSLRVALRTYSDTLDNFRPFLGADEETPAQGRNGDMRPADWSDFLNRYFERKWPRLEVRNSSVLYTRADRKRRVEFSGITVTIVESAFRDAQIEMHARVIQRHQANHVRISGVLNHIDHHLYLNGFFENDFDLLVVQDMLGTEVSLRSFDLHLMSVEKAASHSNVRADVRLGGLEIYSQSIAEKRLHDVDLNLSIHMDIGEDGFDLEEARIEVGRLQLALHGAADRMSDRPQLEFWITLPEIGMDDLLGSLPSGLTTQLRGLKVQGRFAFDCHVFVDWSRLDSVVVDPTLRLTDPFRVLSFGDSVDVTHLRDTFTYSAARPDRPDTAFAVGPANPYFTPLDSLPPFLVTSVILSEDGSFFKNNGFNVYQIERSIAHNIRARRFARGASTISMQFVKNLFLSREKTISRKFQELILTWLLNHERVLDGRKDKEKHKKRLLEIYLNIIEWGPDVYGIGRAAEFYFNKRPKDLTVGESVFLATIIPNPRKYDRYFVHGNSRKAHVNYMNLIKKLLYRDGVITQEQWEESQNAELRIVGAARAFLSDIASPDSLRGEQDLDYQQSLLPVKDR